MQRRNRFVAQSLNFRWSLGPILTIYPQAENKASQYYTAEVSLANVEENYSLERFRDCPRQRIFAFQANMSQQGNRKSPKLPIEIRESASNRYALGDRRSNKRNQTIKSIFNSIVGKLPVKAKKTALKIIVFYSTVGIAHHNLLDPQFYSNA